MFSSFSAQANTLESLSATASEEAYHHDLKVSAALHYLNKDENFGIINKDEYSDMDSCRPEEIDLYTDLGASVNLKPFFGGESESCGAMKNYLAVSALNNDSGSETFSTLEVGEKDA